MQKILRFHPLQSQIRIEIRNGALLEREKKIIHHGNVEIRWIRRDANKSADVVAKLALKGELSVMWRWMPPIELRVATLEDGLVCLSSSPN